MLELLRLELPVELDEALSGSVLHAAFARLSLLQQSAYAEWVGDSPLPAVRRDRAHLVCRVLRRQP
jgi:hypothetical protein